MFKYRTGLKKIMYEKEFLDAFTLLDSREIATVINDSSG